jgi:hypothetical protein
LTRWGKRVALGITGYYSDFYTNHFHFSNEIQRSARNAILLDQVLASENENLQSFIFASPFLQRLRKQALG